jgi:hypothetical protein
MANYFARKAGNINATDVWATTPAGSAADVWSTFTSSDVLHSNNFAVTVNVSTTVGEVRNDNANSATAGGSFTLSNGVTLTGNAFAGSTGTSCVVFNGGSGNSASLVGNATGGSVNSAHGANNTSTGTLNITGNVTGGTATSGTPGSVGANNASTGSLVITGNATGGTSTNSAGVHAVVAGTVTITGNVTGGSGGSVSYGAWNSSTGTITIVGSAIASSATQGAHNASTGTLIATRAVGNAYGIGAAGGTALVAGINSANIASDTRVEELEYGANGMAPTTGAVRIVNKTNNKCLVHLTTGAIKTLADPSDGTGQANQADVRSGVSYALGNRTGTCAVPAAGSVALGVAVDATTGTAVLTPAAVWDALTSGMTTSGSIGARLKNAATLDSTGQQLADALSPVP